MALLEENEAVKHQSKQSSQIDDILKSVNTLESKKLDLARKCIKDVPRELTRLHKLEFLYLEGNSLTCLPEDFFICLLNLKWLDLRNNQITHLPTTIGESRCLRSLLLENNRITRLPLELGFVQSLSGLHLADNPLEFPSKSIVEQGTQDILAFLRFEWTKLQNDNDDPLSCGESHELEEGKLTYDEGKERAQSFTRDEFSDLKLPPINTNVSANHVDATAPESKKPAGLKPGNKSAPNLLHLQKYLTNEITNHEIGRRESPIKNIGVHVQRSEKPVNRGVLSSENKPDKSTSRMTAKSPKKKQSKHQKKSKNVKEPVTVMTAVLNKGGSLSVGYRTEVKEQSMVNQHGDEIASGTVAQVVDEEKDKLRTAPNVVESVNPTEKRQQKNQLKFTSNDFSVDDMVVMKVSEEHFIPGQPCLGKIVSLPDAVGVLLVHYYSGSFDGIWKPMMSRSSPYFRRVPLSKIIYKFKLDTSGRMSKETVEKVKEALEIEH